MNSGIYAIINNINGKKYIGSAVNLKKRWLGHLYKLKKQIHHCAHLQSAWNKYGRDSFKFVCLEECEVDDLIQKEQEYIDKCVPEYNTNKVAGSVLGYKFSEEAKAAMSIQKTGFRHTEESKKKMSEIWSGKPRGKYSEERKKKLSIAHKGKNITKNQSEALAAGRLLAKNNETYKKIGNKLKGRVVSEETKEKMRQAWVIRKARQENIDAD